MRIGPFEIRWVRNNTKCLHPDNKKFIESSFFIGKKEYFQYVNPLDMHAQRYAKYEEFLREAEMRMTGKDALELLELAEDAMEKSKGTDAIILIRSMKYQIGQFVETDTFYRLFTCLFFDIEEDITTYDYDYNEDKIALFKAQPAVSFFFQEPLKKWLPAQNISSTDLEVFLKQSKAAREHIQKTKSKYLKSS